MNELNWVSLPSLPFGLAGMFAGCSGDHIICMGGTSFLNENLNGGVKQWCQDVFLLMDDVWLKLEESLPEPVAYGVSVSYKDSVIIIGGSIGADAYTKAVFSLTWDGYELNKYSYPDLPNPLANMAGALVGDLIVIIGGKESPDGAYLNKCYMLDLMNDEVSWQELSMFPGQERIFPVCTAYDGRFYVFSGENEKTDNSGLRYRNILQDAYSLNLIRTDSSWIEEWQTLASMPNGISAGASPAPVINNEIMFWGGIDSQVAQHSNLETHPGMSKNILWYDPNADFWYQDLHKKEIPSPVTLPTVDFKGSTYFLGGEIKPRVRTEKVIGVSNQLICSKY